MYAFDQQSAASDAGTATSRKLDIQIPIEW